MLPLRFLQSRRGTMGGRKVRIVSRDSMLAQWQTHFINEKLANIGLETEINFVAVSENEFENTDFTSGIDSLLLSGTTDVAVHSLKDINVVPIEGLCIGALSERNDPSDVLIYKKDAVDENLLFKIKRGAVVGTSSLRRKSQINNYRDDLVVVNVRGNIDERIGMLNSDSQLDGIIIAKAGLDRLKLDLSVFNVIRLHPKEFVPAPGQGVIACMVRKEDMVLRKILSGIHHMEVAHCTNVERGILAQLGGLCKSPVGVYCEKDLRGSYHCVLSMLKDDRMIRVKYSQSTTFGLTEQMLRLYNLEIK
jgi:hydroxymethylbilane synthase